MLNIFIAAIGIMSAMPQEADLIVEAMEKKETVQIGTHEFIKGEFFKTPVVFALSGIGKVSAASTATLLISEFDVEEIVFTGVAGGGSDVNVGDIVIGSHYLQHDLDLRPVFPQFHIYSLHEEIIAADETKVAAMKRAAKTFLEKGISLADLGIKNPQVHQGTIVSGDQFISASADHERIAASMKELLPQGFQAIEMEGAAVAQVCKELDIPFIVIRAISDKADGSAAVDFLTFLDRVGSHYSLGVLKEYVTQ
jgi:adenosylhomocysteine nucleosidase